MIQARDPNQKTLIKHDSLKKNASNQQSQLEGYPIYQLDNLFKQDLAEDEEAKFYLPVKRKLYQAILNKDHP